MSNDLLAGDLKFLELGEILQVLGTNGKSGVLRLKSPWNAKEGRIDFIEGTPADASDGEKTGLEGLYALFGWTDGQFFFSNSKVPRERRIHKDRMSIVMDAMRLLDENQIEILGPKEGDSALGSVSKSKSFGTLKLPLIRGDSPDYSDIVDEERYGDGHPIFTEGKFGRWVYVILDGKADLVKETPQGPAKLLRLGPGTYPGTILFFSDDKARSTSLYSAGSIHLGVLNLERLYSELSGKSSEFQALATGLAQRLSKITEAAVVYYRNDLITDIDFSTKMPLDLERGNDPKVYVIKEGSGYLTIDQGECITPLTSLGVGDIIGDLSFLDSALKLSGVKIYGSDNIELATLDTEKIAEEYRQSSQTVAAIFKNQEVRTIVTSWLACRYHGQMFIDN